ncbi:MAG: 3'-5' exonuclease, partial [Bacteroidales bacterium]|nr:3'-5' exonuclease [Bacteroidales bacterium]
VDTETTGLPKNWKAPVNDLNNWPRLVQIAWLSYDINGSLISDKDYIIAPDDYTIPISAVRVHGITTEKAQKEGGILKSILSEFETFITQSEFLVAHNMSFDEKVLGAEFLRNNMGNPLSSMKRICTMERTTSFCAIPSSFGDYKWPSLSELHNKLFGYKIQELHNATSDIRITAKCFWELRRLGII